MPTSRTPIVGRQRELAALSVQLDAAAAGQGRLVVIAGAPGIGKTRLLGACAEPDRYALLDAVCGVLHLPPPAAACSWCWTIRTGPMGRRCFCCTSPASSTNCRCS